MQMVQRNDGHRSGTMPHKIPYLHRYRVDEAKLIPFHGTDVRCVLINIVRVIVLCLASL